MFTSLNTGAIGVKASLTETIAYAKQFDFSGIDFSITEAHTLADQQGMDALRSLFGNAGITPSVWSPPVEFRKDGETWRQGLAALPAYAKFARELGCLRASTWLMPCSNERDFRAHWKFITERLRPVAEILGEQGIRMGLEFVGPKTLRMAHTYDFVYSIDGMLALCAALGENTGLLLDIWHLYTSHGSNDDVRRLSNQDVVSVHINDAPPGIPVDEQMDLVRRLPGSTGVLDLKGFLQALQAIGYDGPVTIEPFDPSLKELAPEAAVAKTAEAMHGVWKQAEM